MSNRAPNADAVPVRRATAPSTASSDEQPTVLIATTQRERRGSADERPGRQ